MDGPRVENLASRHGNPRPISQTTSAPRSSHPNQERNFRVVGPLLFPDRPPLRQFVPRVERPSLVVVLFFFFYISLFYLFIVSVSPPCSVSVACNGQFDDTFSAVGGWVNENLTRERGWKVTMFPFRRVGMVDSTRSLMIRLLLSFSLGKKKSKFLIVEITTVPISIVTLRLSLHDFFFRLKECALDGVFHANYVT